MIYFTEEDILHGDPDKQNMWIDLSGFILDVLKNEACGLCEKTQKQRLSSSHPVVSF